MTTREWYYNVYLNSEYWKSIRQDVLDSYNHKCALCGSGDNLNIHHMSYPNYDREKEDGGQVENKRELICLCKDCHLKIHNREKQLEEALKIWESDFSESLEKNYLSWKKEILNILEMERQYFLDFLGENKTQYYNTLLSCFYYRPEVFIIKTFTKYINNIRIKNGNNYYTLAEYIKSHRNIKSK